MQKGRLSVLPSKAETVLGFCFLVFYLLFLAPLILLICLLLGYYPDDLALNTIYFSFCAAAVLLIFRRLLRGNFTILRQNRDAILQKALIGGVIYLGAAYVLNSAIMLLLPEFTNQNNETLFAMMRDNFPLMCFIAVVLAPLIEETLLRGLLFGSLQRVSRIAAYAVSAVLFSGIHVVGYLPEMTVLEAAVSALQYLPATIVFCALYEQTDCLLAPMLVHGAVNLLACAAGLGLGG